MENKMTEPGDVVTECNRVTGYEVWVCVFSPKWNVAAFWEVVIQTERKSFWNKMAGLLNGP